MILQLVFDCGASFKGMPLNHHLLQRPNLTSTSLGVLLRFTQEPVAVMGNIQAMFHQGKVKEEWEGKGNGGVLYDCPSV